MSKELRIPIGDKELEIAYCEFQKYAVKEGIPLEDEGDWGAWWECWMDGYCVAKMRGE